MSTQPSGDPGGRSATGQRGEKRELGDSSVLLQSTALHGCKRPAMEFESGIWDGVRSFSFRIWVIVANRGLATRRDDEMDGGRCTDALADEPRALVVWNHKLGVDLI